MSHTETDILNIAKRVIDVEAKAILDLKSKLTASFYEAVSVILQSEGRVIVTGMGKSGVIGKKIAATLSSTGTRSIFLHPAEAFHGDLGVVSPSDVIIAISKSGETNEILQILPFFRQNQNSIIALTERADSTLTKNSSFFIDVSVEEEACPLDLAPTSSTTATLVMGDAIAVVLMEMRGFKSENFAKFHPGGSLGRRLLTKVSDVMKTDNLPLLSKDSTASEVVSAITKGKIGAVLIVEDENVIGIITDGDLRRSIETSSEVFFKRLAGDIMTSNPRFTTADRKISEVEQEMIELKINLLPVINSNKLVGVVQIYDIAL